MADINSDRDWESKYREGDTPWDSRRPSQELIRVIAEHQIEPCRVIELGCGTGTNAVYLARQDFDVTAIEGASNALAAARDLADQHGVRVAWIDADVQSFGTSLDPFDFVFDRGVYHCCRRVDLGGYLTTLRHVTRPDSLYLSLAGSANEQDDEGIPKVSAEEIASELDGLFEVLQQREFHFEDAGGAQGPLGWSTLLRRR